MESHRKASKISFKKGQIANQCYLFIDDCIIANKYTTNIGCSFKFILKVGVEESIVNAPLVSLHMKNTNNTKSEVRFKQLIRGAFTIDFQ
jgi:hypothetical protein